MTKIYLFLIFGLIGFETLYSQGPAENLLSYHFNESKRAYKDKDFQNFLFHLKKADSISPEHPTITYNLAAAYSLIEEYNTAQVYLKKAVLMNSKLYPQDDEDFKKFKELQQFEEIDAMWKNLMIPIDRSHIAFINDEKDLHPESIAFDPITRNFLIGSVHKNKIVSYNPITKKTMDWKNSGEDGLWAVMGMKVDSINHVLWVCSTSTKEMSGYDSELEGKTSIHKFNLENKALLNRYVLDGGHWFGDLVLDKKGVPFISDSKKPIVYTIKNDELIVFEDFSDRLFNLQGLAFDESNDLLYIADYKIGLHVLNTKTRKFLKVNHGDDIITKGIDGLYFNKGMLIAIHNGLNPFRICQYHLDETGQGISEIEYIDRGREELDEPTLGVIVNNDFLYIANSPWGKYDKEGKLISNTLTSNIILRYRIQ